MVDKDNRVEICDTKNGPQADFETRPIHAWGKAAITPNDIKGFEFGSKKIRVLQIFVGYADEEIASERFQQQLQADEKIFLDSLGHKNFDLGYVSKNVDIGLNQQERLVTVSHDGVNALNITALWLDVLKAHPEVDIIAVRPNPAIVNQADLPRPLYFGVAAPAASMLTAAGPDMSGKYNYNDLHSGFLLTHESIHVLSDSTIFSMGGGKVDMNDSHAGRNYSYRQLASGANAELTLAPDVASIPKYYPDGLSPRLDEAVKKTKPVIEDIGYQCTETSWLITEGPPIPFTTVHPVYALNAGPDIMEQSFSNAEMLSGKQIVTPLQRELINQIAVDYLANRNDIETEIGSQVVKHLGPALYGAQNILSESGPRKPPKAR